MRGECNSKTGKLSFTGLDTAEPTLILCKDSESMAHHKVRNVFFILRNSALYLPLYKISCTRQCKSKLSLRSFALSLYKIICTRQYKSKLSLRSFAISLYKIICTRQCKSKLSLRSFAISLYKIICTRQYKSKLSLRSFAISLYKISCTRQCKSKHLFRHNHSKIGTMTRLYLVRHGETVDNVNCILQGQTQGCLTPEGIRQAESVRDRMAGERIDAFVSSDLKRSYDTCAIIAAPHGMKVVTTPLLRERDWGGFTGMYIPDLKGVAWPDDVETLEALRERAARFLDFIRGTYAGKTVLAVGHGIINKAVQSVYRDVPMNEIEKMTNAEVRILDL